MRVALLSYNARFGDAVGNQVAEKLSFFVDGGADVRVFVESDAGLHPGIRPHCRLLAPEPKGDGWQYLCDSDLVIVDYSQAYALLGLLPLLAHERPRILLDYHGVTPPELFGGQNAEALADGLRWRGLVGFADAALVHSRSTRRELLKPTGFPDERTTALGYPIDGAFWQPGEPGCDLRQRLGIGDARVLLFVGRLARNKRVPLLADLLARLADREPAVHAIVIGDDSDIYALEADACHKRAAQCGVADRLHLLGRLPLSELRDAYRSADCFVIPSLHEGFCIPVIEAMACGLPVVAAAATALPETVGDAGLTFVAEDVDDFARQVTRVLESSANRMPTRTRSIAIVAPRFGEGFAGGAERSLRLIARSLHDAGQNVEVFTTCARREGLWTNELAEGSESVDGLRVHRFPAQPDAPRLRSPKLIEALVSRAAEFERIIVGPYLFELTREVARRLPEKTLLLPCFHDEPEAREPGCRSVFTPVAGVLYHSEEEKVLGEAELGLNHPGASVIGTHIDPTRGNAERGQALVGAGKRYVVYCGRYTAEKGLPLLLAFAHDYAAAYPERFTFVFMGEGNVAIPRAPWAVDLGFVDESVKRDVLAGAAALMHASERESLSLVCLEAWAQATPVIGSSACEVFVGHLSRGAGGKAVKDAATFAAALDDLWQYPDHWADLGRRGRDYVQTQFGSADAFTAKLFNTINDGDRSLSERLRDRGLQRAARYHRSPWRGDFAEAIEAVLDAPVRAVREHVQVAPRGEQLTVSIARKSALVAVRVTNRGTHPIVEQGPARYVLRSYVGGDADRPWRVGGPEVPLPGLVMPGQSVAAAIPVSVPTEPGVYRICFRAIRADGQAEAGPTAAELGTTFALHVTANHQPDGDGCEPLLDQVRLALAEAHDRQRLPDGYTEVCEGKLAALKRWVKRKILGNFQRAYVDVLSRQQSEFNRQVLNALQELSECCATLDHARGSPKPAAPANDTVAEGLRELVRHLTQQLTESREALAQLHERVARLESGRGGKRRDVA